VTSGPGDVEVVVLAEIGIGHGLTGAAFDVIQQQG
jgi:hypothetical protein